MTYTGPIAREATARQSSAAPRPPKGRPGPDATPTGNAASRPAKPKPEARAHEWDRTGRMRTCLVCGQQQFLRMNLMLQAETWIPADLETCKPPRKTKEAISRD
jgi:hypothetical protein